MAEVVREIGVPVVMGGPHVNPPSGRAALGRDGGKRYADAIAVGEADSTWPQIVEDAANCCLKEPYRPVDDQGKEVKPSLDDYPDIGWTDLDLDQLPLFPRVFRAWLSTLGDGWGSFRIIPIESGLAALSDQRERGQRDAAARTPRPPGPRKGGRALRRRQFCDQPQTDEIAAGRHHRRRRSDCPG